MHTNPTILKQIFTDQSCTVYNLLSRQLAVIDDIHCNGVLCINILVAWLMDQYHVQWIFVDKSPSSH